MDSDPPGAEPSGPLLQAAREGHLEEADRLAAALASFEPAELRSDPARLAFWINVYNARLLHELGRRPRAGSLLRHRSLFRTASYEIGGLGYSLDVIEHGVLRRNARPPYALRRRLREGDPRLAAAPARLDPRVHFALNCGARSCPPIRSYSAADADALLEQATRAYLSVETEVDAGRGAVTLPGLMKLYRADFGDRRQQLEFVAARLPSANGEWVRENAAALRPAYSGFDWTLSAGRG